jgi:hypothetical protein
MCALYSRKLTVMAGTDYTASRLDLAVNQQAHCHRGGDLREMAAALGTCVGE